jgi:hypothetical protein
MILPFVFVRIDLTPATKSNAVWLACPDVRRGMLPHRDVD